MSKDNVTRRISIFVNGKEVENSLKGVDGEIKHVQNSLRKLVEGTEDYDKKKSELSKNLVDLRKRQSEYREELGLTNTALNRTGFSVKQMATSIVAAFSIGSVVSSFVGGIKSAFKTINDFEQAVADLSSITGASGDDLKYLKDQAIILGESTKGGAKAVVDAYKLIASAKPELLDNVDALNKVTESTLLLSKAAGMEMPEAATALTDAMNQFGADAEQARIFVDSLANGAKYGAAEIPQVTEALLKFGAVAKSSNINIQESTALIELLAENGLKGAEAGTALRNVLLKLSAPDALPKEAKVEMERLGISMGFLKDKTVPIQEKLEALKPLLKDNASIVKIFGTENATAAINVIGHTDRLKELTSKMNEVGTAQEQAAIKMDTVNGKTELLKSKYDSLILSVGSGDGVVSSFFKTIIEGADGALGGLIRLNTSWNDLYKKAGQEGKKSGVNNFQDMFNNLKDTGKPEEVAKSIKTAAAKNYKVLLEAYIENEKKIKDFNPYAINFGESGKDLKNKKEELTKSLAEKAAIIKEANQLIVNESKKANEQDEKNSKETNYKKTETQLESEKKQEAAREKSRLKKEKLDKEADKNEYDRAKSLADAKADLAKATLDQYISNLRSNLDKEKALTPESIVAETERLAKIKDAQIKFNNDELARKTADLEAKAKLEGTSQEVLNAQKEALTIEYETKNQEIELGFQQTTNGLKLQFEQEQKILKAEQLALDNELALAEADTKAEAAKIKQEQDYQAELQRYAKLHTDKKITDEEYLRFKQLAKQKQDEMDRVRELQQLQGTLGGLNSIAGAIGEMFGQSKELAIVQAGINGALAVTSILAQYPKFDGGFAMWAGILAAGITTVAQISKITSAKPPKAPKFFYGGSTGTNAALGYDQYGPVTGYVHKNEYVIPEVMTQDPRFANTIGWLEANRQNKMRGFVDGGETTPGVVPQNANVNSETAQMNGLLSALLNRLENPVSPNLIIGYKDVEQIEDMKNEINSSSQNGTIG